jgi:hypothetical protein
VKTAENVAPERRSDLMKTMLATCFVVVLGLTGTVQAKGMGPDFYKVQRTPGKPKASEANDPQHTGTVQEEAKPCTAAMRKRKAC